MQDPRQIGPLFVLLSGFFASMIFYILHFT